MMRFRRRTFRGSRRRTKYAWWRPGLQRVTTDIAAIAIGPQLISVLFAPESFSVAEVDSTSIVRRIMSTSRGLNANYTSNSSGSATGGTIFFGIYVENSGQPATALRNPAIITPDDQSTDWMHLWSVPFENGAGTAAFNVMGMGDNARDQGIDVRVARRVRQNEAVICVATYDLDPAFGVVPPPGNQQFTFLPDWSVLFRRKQVI